MINLKFIKKGIIYPLFYFASIGLTTGCKHKHRADNRRAPIRVDANGMDMDNGGKRTRIDDNNTHLDNLGGETGLYDGYIDEDDVSVSKSNSRNKHYGGLIIGDNALKDVTLKNSSITINGQTILTSSPEEKVYNLGKILREHLSKH